ncbi:MAG: phosphatase PAP2 family protein [Planctomycetes bacterium]|nr:phosphatase PAP2 family protein [Planctomycetota bacterium]
MNFIQTLGSRKASAARRADPAGYRPLLATAWGRVLAAGVVVGLIPVVMVVWLAFDPQFASKSNEETFKSFFFFRELGMLGDALPWILLSAVLWLIGFFGKRRDIASWAVFLILSIAASGIVVNLVKFIFLRTRPNWQGVVPEGGSFSFPSGHSVTVGAIAMVCVLRWPKLAPAAAALVVMVCVNRIVSLNHYPTDVIVGLILGLISTLAIEWCWWRYQPHTFAGLR